jgi:hypothetical protein
MRHWQIHGCYESEVPVYPRGLALASDSPIERRRTLCGSARSRLAEYLNIVFDAFKCFVICAFTATNYNVTCVGHPAWTWPRVFTVYTRAQTGALCSGP